MTGREYDFEELRPIGEASHVPDDRRSECGDGQPRRQRSATPTTGYPERTGESDNECRSCGTSIPTSRTKCRFCLTNYLDDSPADAESASVDQRFLHIVHFLVESPSRYGALAKAGAATEFLVSNTAEPAIDDCQLIDDLDVEPAAQLTSQWPTLPGAVRIGSADGEQLLTAAREQTVWGEESESQQDHATYLYDERGESIPDEQQLATVLDELGDDGWLVPAMALQTVTQSSDRCTVESATSEQLECRSCDRTTAHRFRTRESLPDEQWSGQPIWKCRVCGTARYGPDPS